MKSSSIELIRFEGVVVAVGDNALLVKPDGGRYPLHVGDILRPGDLVFTGEQPLLLDFGDERSAVSVAADCVGCIDEQQGSMLAAASEQLDVAALQQAILEGVDPTAAFEAAAAGNAGGAGGAGSGGNSFVVITRDGASTQVEFGADTDPAAAVAFAPVDEPAATLADDDSTPLPPVNTAPQTADVSLTTAEDTAVSGAVAGTDLDGDALSYVLGTGPANGTVVLNADGTFTYTPNSNYNGSDSFTVTVSDGNGGTVNSTVTIGVTPVNDPPTAEDVGLTTPQGRPISGQLPAHDRDGDPLSYSLEQGPSHGQLVVSPDGTFTYTPDPDYSGDDSITVTISDGQGGSVTATVTVAITPINDAPVAVNDAFSTAEDVALVLSPAQLLANDSDVDGDSLSISSVQGAVNGSVALVNGNVVFTPNADYHGPASFSYSISDGKGGTATASVSLTVTPVNDGPVIDPNSANVDPQTGNYQLSTPEETPVDGAVVATDVDGDVLSYTLGTGPTNGTVVLNPNGTFTYTPNSNYNGSDSFTVTVSDGNGGTVTSTVAIGVTPVNDAPVAVNDAFSTAEDVALVLSPAQLLANDSDVDGDSLSISSVQGAVNGSVALVDGNVVFTPNADYHGPASFSYSISDGKGGTASASVSLTVTPANDAPVIDPDSANVDPQTGNYQLSTPEETPVSGAVVATDVDGDALSYALGTGPTNGTVVLNPNGTFTYTPNANYNGSDSFTVTVSDGNGGSVTSTVAIGVTPVNDAPVAVDDAFSTAEDVALVLSPAQLLANDSDGDGDSLSISSVQGAVNGSVALVNGNVVFTPNADYHGPASFSYSISDGKGGTATASVSLTVTPVNDGPLIDPESANVDPQTGNYQLSTPEETPVSGAVVATDVDGDALSYTLGTGPTNGTVVLNPNGTFTYTPNSNYNGSDSFTVTVSDGNGGTVTSTVAIGVTPVNDAPVAVNDAFSTAEDVALVLSPAQLLANDSDVDGDSLSISSVQGAVNGSVALVDGNVVFTPNADYHGPASFSYSISDGKGGTATASVNLTVTPVNDGPVIDPESANVDPQTGNYQLSTPEETPVSGAVVATDVDGDALSYVLGTGPANGSVVLNADGTFTYTPNAHYNGSDSFVVTVSDGNGGSVTSTVAIGVTPVNDAPVAVDDAFTTAEDVALVLSPAQLLANDSDVDGDSLSISSVQGAVNGSVALVNGNVVFTPNADYHGPASFSYSISDGKGGTATASVSLTVTPVNDAPVIDPESANVDPQTGNYQLSTPEETPVDGAVVASDVDGDALSYTLGTGPANGTVVLNPDGTFTYTPNSNYNGSDSFTVTVSDGNGGSVTSTVAIGVTPINDAPVAVNDAFSTAEDVALVLSPAQLLANDSDVDGDSLSISSVQGAVNGSVALVNGNVVFTPNADYHGPASFSYSISDGKGGTATASVSLTVTPVNDGPVIDPESANVDPQTGNYQLSTPEETPVDGAVVATDVDGDALSYVLGTGPTNGTVVLNPDGTFTYTPNANYNGSDSFTVTVSDGNGGSVTSTVAIGVTPVNDAPVAVNDAFSTAEDVALVLSPAQLLANDSDVDGDSLSISSVQGAVNGSVALVNGNIVFTPNADYHGPASFSYSISDGKGGTATASVNLTVTEANEVPVAVANGFGLKLDGEFYSYQQSGSKVPNLTSLAQVEAVIASRPAPDTRFVATSLDYGMVTYRDYLGKSGLAAPNKLQEFLKGDAASLSSDPVDGSDAIIRLTGSLDLKPGTYQFRVTADDGFSIRLNGQVVAEVPVNQSPTTTEFAEFTVTEGGTLPLEIIYWDQGIHAQLKVELRPAGGQYQVLAADDDFIITEGNPLIIDQQLLLANDSDADGDSLSIVAVTNGQYGTVLFDGDQLIYQASGNVPAGTSREDSFSYTISDGKGGTSVASVKVLVVGAVGTPAADSVPDVVGDAGDNLMFSAAVPLAGTSGVAMDGAGGNDQLTAGSGNDLLRGGAGDDQLSGGSNGSLASEGYLGDLLSGGSGADLFIWRQGDDQQQGGGVAHDYVSDFSLADGDRLDLSDLLQGETVATIDQFLSVSFAADETVLQLAPQGDGSVSQQIHLQGWSQQDWQAAYGDANLDASNLVQKLVDEGKLVIGS